MLELWNSPLNLNQTRREFGNYYIYLLYGVRSICNVIVDVVAVAVLVVVVVIRE